MKINSFGAQLLSTELLNGLDLFYLSPFYIKNTTHRGGVPIIFPQFGNIGKLKKHGFARDLNWVQEKCNNLNNEIILKYSLSIDRFTINNWNFDSKLFITFRLIKNTSLSIKFEVHNIDKKSFSFTGGLHPYFLIKNRSNLKITGLEDSLFIDTDPLINTFNLNDNTGIERLYLSNSDIKFYNGFNWLKLSVSGFENWMIWNPGTLGAKKIVDLPDTDWEKFICIEPLVNKNSVLLQPNDFFIGELIVEVL
jgi:glucose-6-phosphate 1-epimerase